MPNGYALCVGLNNVDPVHYQGWDGDLVACERDALDMTKMLTRIGYQAVTKLTEDATREAVLKSIHDAATICKPGDIFVFTNSSHGGQVPDTDGDESDGADETICMFDGEILDDELYAAFKAFAKGVRVLMISDSCHSGTITRDAVAGSTRFGVQHYGRAMPPDVAFATYHANHAMYDAIQSLPDIAAARGTPPAASVMGLGACADNQTAGDGAINGVFTGSLLRVWNGGAFNGNYAALRARAAALMPRSQSPRLYWAHTPDLAFLHQRAFEL